MKSRGVDKVFSVFCLLAIVIISISCNFADFWNGHNGEINPITLTATIVYICYLSAFSFFAHKRKHFIIIMIWATITLICAVFVLLKSTSALPIRAGLPFVLSLNIVFLSPFQGMTAILSNNRLIIFSIISIISTSWIILSILNFRRHHKDIKTNKQAD